MKTDTCTHEGAGNAQEALEIDSSGFLGAIEALKVTIANLPETVERTPEQAMREERKTDFMKIADPAFTDSLDRSRLKNQAAFDAVSNWDGAFPGPCAFGETGTAKTRAAWYALGKLYIKHAKPFKWFTARRLMSEMKRYDGNDCLDEFFRDCSHFRVLFIDDIDKINWQFESEVSFLFAFWDWVYRRRIPVIVTTNKSPEWWAEKMGDAFARRLTRDAHYAVKF